MEFDQNSLRQLWGKLVAESWNDPKLRSRLVADPVAVLKEHKVSLPDGLKVRALDDDGRTLFLHIPPKPAGELGENELDAVAGGTQVAQAANATIAVRSVGNKIDPIAGISIIGPVV